MSTRKILAITIALSKSQLRASRSGVVSRSLFRRPAIVFILDGIAFVVCLGLGYLAGSILLTLSDPLYSQAFVALKEAMIFVPALVPSIVLIAGLLFELNVSSKFSASDTVNWLPVTQVEYVVASALSVAYNYSISVAVITGITLVPAIVLGLGWLWGGMAALSVLTLFMGGTLVEILRAAINRVSSLVMGRARKGALFLRLVLLVGIILVFEILFNFNFLLSVISVFSTRLTAVAFVPIFWGSLAVEGIADSNPAWVAGFTAATIAFTTAMIWVAVKVRVRYWSPNPVNFAVTKSEYAPGASRLLRLGLTHTEAAIVKKDLKGVTRRRELLSYFAIPVVLVIVFVLETYTSLGAGGNPTAGGEANFVVDIPSWFIGGLFALMISSISFGQESRAVMVLYSSPISAKELLRAKAFFALSFALAATVGTSVLFSVLGRVDPLIFVENLTISIAVAVEEVSIGLAFGARYPDFQERPRPRFVDPVWILVMVVVGMGILFATGIPILLRDIVSVALPGALPTVEYAFVAALVFASVVTTLFYRWAGRSVERLLSEYRI